MNEQMTKRELDISMAAFASNLETARILWRRYRPLVEASKFPEPFAAALRDQDGREPNESHDCCDQELVEAGVLPLKAPALVGAEFVRNQEIKFLQDGVEGLVLYGRLPEISFLAHMLNLWLSNYQGERELYLADLLYQEITGKAATSVAA